MKKNRLSDFKKINNPAERGETSDETSEDEEIHRNGQRDLELNHTHYLMLDGDQSGDGNIKNYRTNFWLQIAKYHEDHGFPSEL